MFGTVDHAARRRRLSEGYAELGVDAVLISRLVNVRYLTGFTGSNGQLLATREGGVFFTDSRYEEQSRHQIPDLHRVIYARDFAASLEEACRAEGIGRLGFEGAGVTYRSWEEMEQAAFAELVPLKDDLERLRWAKDPQEIELIERAQEVTDQAFQRLTAKLAPGMTEREAAFELDLSLREGGAERIAFDSIVAFGESAAEPHHQPTDRPLGRGDLVKLDFGGVVEGYHSDMTRTVAFGEPVGELREVYDLVLRAQLAGIGVVRAGVSGGAADQAARAVIREAGHGDRFGHSLGHGVGLEIHEGPTLRDGGEDILPEGAVVTVEPGVYLPGTGGVRIEDMVVVTAEGCRPLPRTTKELVVL